MHLELDSTAGSDTSVMDYKSIFKSWLLVALGVLIASHIFTGIRYTDASALVVAVLLLSLCNVFFFFSVMRLLHRIELNELLYNLA